MNISEQDSQDCLDQLPDVDRYFACLEKAYDKVRQPEIRPQTREEYRTSILNMVFSRRKRKG